MVASRLGYIVLGVEEPSKWETFGSETLGMMANTDDSGNVCLKMDDHPFRVLVCKSDHDGLLYSGWEIDDLDTYEEIRSKLIEAGFDAQTGSDAEAGTRCVSRFFRSTDPSGNNFEVYFKRTNVGEPFVSPTDVTEFVTGDMGLGHVVIPAPNLDETRGFYESMLGLQLSDDLSMAGGGNGQPDVRIYFFHADNPRHHSLALFNQPVPTKIVHFMLEVTNLDEVGKCLDRVNAKEIPLMASLGRHCNDNMVSFYVYGPGHIPVEFGYDGRRLDLSTFKPTVSTVGDHWGHDYQM